MIWERIENGQMILCVKILGTSHNIALLQSLIKFPPLPQFQCCLNQTPFDHPNIELGGRGDEKALNVCFHLDILGNMTKTQKFASVPIYFDQDCRSRVLLSAIFVAYYSRVPNTRGTLTNFQKLYPPPALIKTPPPVY